MHVTHSLTSTFVALWAISFSFSQTQHGKENTHIKSKSFLVGSFFVFTKEVLAFIDYALKQKVRYVYLLH